MAAMLRFPSIFLLCALVGCSYAIPLTPSSYSTTDLPSNTTEPNLQIYKDAREELSCYTLPYGGLGFVNHILLTYTTLCIAIGRAPLIPWRQIEIPLTRVLLCTTAFAISFAISVDAAVQCRHTTAFEFIGIEHIFIAATVYGIAMFSREESWTTTSDQRGNLMLGMVLLFLPGIVVGLIGTTKLAVPHAPSIKWLQIAVSIGCIVVLMIVYIASGRNVLNTILITLAIVLFIVLPVYVEWWISVMTNLLPGLPSWNHKILFWLYFGVNRLPMAVL
jgi:hypothetical protein